MTARIAVALAKRNAAEMCTDTDDNMPFGQVNPRAVGGRVDQIRLSVVGARLYDESLCAMDDQDGSSSPFDDNAPARFDRCEIYTIRVLIHEDLEPVGRLGCLVRGEPVGCHLGSIPVGGNIVERIEMQRRAYIVVV